MVCEGVVAAVDSRVCAATAAADRTTGLRIPPKSGWRGGRRRNRRCCRCYIRVVTMGCCNVVVVAAADAAVAAAAAAAMVVVVLLGYRHGHCCGETPTNRSPHHRNSPLRGKHLQTAIRNHHHYHRSSINSRYIFILPSNCKIRHWWWMRRKIFVSCSSSFFSTVVLDRYWP